MRSARRPVAPGNRFGLTAAAPPGLLTLAGAGEGFELLAAGEGEPADKPRAFRMTAYTGVAMRVGYGPPVVVDLAGLTVPRQDLPILRQHDAAQIVGHTTAVEATARALKLSGLVSGVGDAAAEVVRLAANGFPWQSSIGAEVGRLEFVDAGVKAAVNGRSFTGPVYVARQSTLREVSFVPIGADGATTATVAAAHSEGAIMTFAQWLASRGVADEGTLTDGVRTALRAQFDAEQRPGSGPAADPVAEVRRQLAAESERAAAIRAACNRHGNPTITVTENGQERRVPLEAHAIAANWDAARAETRAELEALRAARTSPTPVAPGTRGGGPLDVRLIQAAIVQAAGLQADQRRQLEAGFDAQTLERAHTAYRGRLSLQQLLIDCAYAGGYTGPANFAGYHADILRAAFSNHEVAGILSNTANKFLLMGYMAVEDTWSRISSRRNASDFKTMTSYRMTGAFSFEKVGPTGELAHGQAGEQSFTNKVDTYGKMFAVTRQDQINDDLGALTDLPAKIGRGGALKLNKEFWTEFLDNAAFFAAGNANYFSGGTTNLQSGSLAKAVELFRKQTDPDGEPIGVEPRILLVPPEIETTARELHVSTNHNTGGSSTSDRVPNANVHANRYRPEVSSHLSNAGYTGYSATGWYLLADPADEPVIEVAFLNGVETPTVETADADFNVLGIQMRGFWDFGMKKQSHRGGVKSKGAA